MAWLTKLRKKTFPFCCLRPTLDTPSGYEIDKLNELRELEEMIIETGENHKVGVVQVMRAWERYVKYTGNIEDLLAGINHSSELGHRLTANELLSWIPYIGYEEVK